MSKLTHRIRIASISLVVLFGIVLLGVSLPIGGWNTFSVQTGSMEPAIPTGSLVFVHRTPAADLRPGDVITYTNPADKTQTVTHRLLAVRTNEMGSQEFITQGDANTTADEPVSSGQIVGVVKQHVPYMGKVTNFILHPLGLALLIYIPALAIIIEEIRRLSAYYRSRESYRLAGYTHHHGNHHTFLGAKVAVGIMVLSLGIAVPVHAALQSKVTLTGNTISSASTPQPPNPPSQCTINASNNVTVTNTNNQTATTGDATNTNNTNGGNATSGDASNTSNTSTTVVMNNSSTCP